MKASDAPSPRPPHRAASTRALFEKEIAAGGMFEKLIAEESLPPHLTGQLTDLSRHYRRLLRQAMTLTRVSDSTQLDLVRTGHALTDALQRVQRLNEEKDNLIAMAAHDLRTPLSGIRGLASMIETAPQDGSEPQQLAGEIGRCSDRLLQMISNLLELHRLETSTITPEPIEVPLGAIASSLNDHFRHVASQKQIQFDVSVSSDPEAVVRVDVILLMRVAENLISNALKYSPPGCPVAVRLQSTETELMVAVKDQGPGISQADQAHLFEKFVRLSARPTAGEPSTGLGLALAHSIVRGLGGSIACESALGTGSIFTAHFPLTP